MVNIEKSPAAIGLGAKTLLMLAPGRLVRDASAGCGLLAPPVAVTAPAGIIFVRLPLTVMVTLRVSVQVPFAGRLPPLKDMVLVPGFPVSVPPQVPVEKLGGFAMIIPGGIVSVKVIPFSGVVLVFDN